MLSTARRSSGSSHAGSIHENERFGSALETCVGARDGLRTAFEWAESRAAERGEKARALGYGVYPLFEDAAANAAWSGPFVRREDVERINPEALWNALS